MCRMNGVRYCVRPHLKARSPRCRDSRRSAALLPVFVLPINQKDFQTMYKSANRLLLTGAILSATAAFLHLGCIVFGAAWYRFMGAGEAMAHMAEQGQAYPAVLSSVIAALLFVWSAYALSGAGIIQRLPFLKFGLCVISALYVFRGLAFFSIMPLFPGNSPAFWLISSAICLGFGLVHIAGLRQVWDRL